MNGPKIKRGYASRNRQQLLGQQQKIRITESGMYENFYQFHSSELNWTTASSKSQPLNIHCSIVRVTKSWEMSNGQGTFSQNMMWLEAGYS